MLPYESEGGACPETSLFAACTVEKHDRLFSGPECQRKNGAALLYDSVSSSLATPFRTGSSLTLDSTGSLLESGGPPP